MQQTTEIEIKLNNSSIEKSRAEIEKTNSKLRETKHLEITFNC